MGYIKKSFSLVSKEREALFATLWEGLSSEKGGNLDYYRRLFFKSLFFLRPVLLVSDSTRNGGERGRRDGSVMGVEVDDEKEAPRSSNHSY